MCEEDDPDFIALRGDPSDKLPGAAGVGPKRAAQLVRRYNPLDGVLEAGLFQTRLKCSASFGDRDHGCVSAAALARRPEADMGLSVDLARSWRLNQLADRLG
jgi:DNA polymerase I